jgi:hypothetical protein
VLENDGDEFRWQWNGMEDPESASARGVRVFTKVLDNRLDPVKHLDLIKAAVEPAWDGPHGNIHLVHEALLKVEIAVYDAEKKLVIGTPAQLELQATVQKLVAKSWHRKRNYKQAVLVAFNMIKRLEELEGSREELLDIVARPTESAVAQAAIEVLGVFVAALRRAEARREFKPDIARALCKVAHDLVMAYLGPDLNPRVIYPGTDALAAQSFYRFVHDPEASERLVEAFYELDTRTRPDEKRSGVTAHAREAEYASYKGEQDRAREEARWFVVALERLGMVRHLGTIREQGYFAT